MNWCMIVVETCLNYFINVYLCLCVDGFWIGVVVLKFEWEMRKMVVFGENELYDDFEMKLVF